MNNPEKTVELFANGLNCSQAILTVFGEPYGLNSDMARKLGRTLGGGMGRMARTCGAVTAAVLVLGLARDDQDEGEARKASFSRVQELFKRFETRHKTSECKNLLGADMSTEEGTKKIQDQQLVRNLCPAFVRDAAMMLEELLKP
ncbi:MAG: C_GCAxxG_C_C family protein [Desulfomonile tiedjei]|nr:C_GCAxxG_C_C family protein [Desulfomonile tiedjei]